jgi:hypothetical protein
LPALGNGRGEIGSGKNAVVPIGKRLQGFPELSKGLHSHDSTNPFKKCNDLLSSCAIYPFCPISTAHTSRGASAEANDTGNL